MNRDVFINKLKMLYLDNYNIKNDSFIVNFNINQYNNAELLIKNELKNTLKKINSNLNFNNYNIYQYNNSIKENHMIVNANDFFDHIISTNQIESKNVFLYRIVNKDDLGVYDAGGRYLFVGEQRRTDPSQDDKLNKIFYEMNDYSSTESYKQNWFFAFETIDSLFEWIDNEESFDNLVKSGFKIKEIKIQENAVIKGEGQVIYLDNSVIEKKDISLKKYNYKYGKKEELEIDTKKKSWLSFFNKN